jgi:O-antigen/teichoic acid export membrane protein
VTVAPLEQPRFGSVGWSVIVRGVSFPITALCTFATTAVAIRYAGGTAYGAIAVVSTLSQLLPYADLGIGAGVMNAVSTSKAGDKARIGAVASAIRWLIVPFIVLVTLGTLGATAFSWSELLGIKASEIQGLDWATAFAIILFAVGIPMGVGQRVLVGLSMNPLAVGLSSLVSIVTLASTLLIVATAGPIAALAIAPASGALVSAAVACLIGLRLVRFRLSYVFRVREFRSPGLLAQGISYLVLIAALAAALQGGRVLLAQSSTLTEVASYSLMMQLYLPIWSFFSVGGIALWPIFAKMRMDGGVSQIPAISKMAGLFASAALCGGLGIVFCGGWVADLISGGEIRLSMALLLACASFLIVQAVQFVLGMALTSPADLRFQATCAVPMAVAVITLTSVTASQWGAVAPFFWAALGVALFQIVPNALRVRWNEARRPKTTECPDEESEEG